MPLLRTYTNIPSARGFRFGIAVARFNSEITEGLLAGAREALITAGAEEGTMCVYYVPGSFELPLMAQRLAQTGRFDAIICLGAIIQGETPHFEYVAAAAQQGIVQVSLQQNIPVTFGVVTAQTMEQAIQRSSDPQMNRGREAAIAALEMIMTLREVSR